MFFDSKTRGRLRFKETPRRRDQAFKITGVRELGCGRSGVLVPQNPHYNDSANHYSRVLGKWVVDINFLFAHRSSLVP